MSYRLKQSKEKAVAAWIVDTATPYLDHTGSGSSATLVGTAQGTTAALVAGADYATIFSNAGQGQFAAGRKFYQGFEDKPFALEAWVLPMELGTQQVLGHQGALDGLWIDGTNVHFSTNYQTAGGAGCTFDLGVLRAVHLVGVHTANQNLLYVNGELVDTIDIAPEQRDNSYLSTNTFLYSGGYSPNKVAINGVAIYTNITPEAIKRNYLAGRSVITQDAVPSQFEGIPLYLDASVGAVYFERSYTTKADFLTGYGDNTNIEEDRITGRLYDGTSEAGTAYWYTSFPLDILGVDYTYGVFVEWTGKNVTIEYMDELNGWTAMENRQFVPGIGPTYATANQTLELRAYLTEGFDYGEVYLDSMNVVGFKSGALDSTELRTIALGYPAVPRKDFEPIEYNDNNGVILNGAQLTIGPDTGEEPIATRTIELWVKPSTTNFGVGATGGSFNRYKNGVLFNSGTIPVNQWSLIHYVFSGDITGEIGVSGDAIVGQMALYPNTLTAAQVTQIYRSYTGVPVLNFNDTNTIGIAEVATPVVMYVRDWSVEAGA